MPYSPPSDFTSSTTVSSMDASSELTYTGFVVLAAAAAVASQNIDFAEEGNSNSGDGVAAMHSGLLANDLESKGWSNLKFQEPSGLTLIMPHNTNTPEAVGERRHWPLPSLLPRRRMEPTGGELPVVAAAAVSGD